MDHKTKPIFTQNEHGKFENRSCDSPCEVDISQLKRENELLKEKLSAIRGVSGVSEGGKHRDGHGHHHRHAPTKSSEAHCRSCSTTSPNMMPCHYNPMCYSKNIPATYNEICDRLEQEYLLDAMYRHPSDFYNSYPAAFPVGGIPVGGIPPPMMRGAKSYDGLERMGIASSTPSCNKNNLYPAAFPSPLMRGAKSYNDISRHVVERDFLPNQMTYVRPRSRTRSFDACRPSSSRSTRSATPRSRTRSFEDPGFSFRWDEDPFFLERWKHSGFTRMPFRPRSTLDIAIGMKVSLHRSDGRLSRGIVRWIGILPNLPGEYIGVELETQTGKHDGYLNGIRYFKCRESCGIFVKSSKIIMAWR